MNRELEQDFDSAFDFRETLTPETDRGCALMAASYLDSRLAECLTQYFVDDAPVVESLVGPNMPLSTFSSRIDTAYLLGLISPNSRSALHLIRKIRNEFGHMPEPLSFDDQKHKIAQRCEALGNLFDYKSGTHRAMFTMAVMGILALINVRLRATKHSKPRPNTNLKTETVQEPDDTLLKAMVNVANANADEMDHAIVKLQGTCQALIQGKIRHKIAEKLAARILKRIREE